jgi:hypothetical protein
MYCELCGSPNDTNIQCISLDALVDILDRSSFRVNETPRGFGGDHIGGGIFRGGHIGRRGIVFFYHCDEQDHIARDCPLSRRPWCAHYRNNIHTTEDCLNLISTWEDHARKIGSNLINYEPNINVITIGGTNTNVHI